MVSPALEIMGMRMPELAKRAARESGERRAAGFAYVTTRGRFVLTARDNRRDQVIYAVILRGRGRYLMLAVAPRTFRTTNVAVTSNAPETARLGHANRLQIG
jgi:hypothetical protein